MIQTAPSWPIVEKPCIYCRQPVGAPHGPECVTVNKRVKIRYSFEIEIDVPHHWDAHQIEFHRNEGSWCASNAIDDITTYAKERDKQNHGTDYEDGEVPCLCSECKCEFLGVVDDTPILK